MMRLPIRVKRRLLGRFATAASRAGAVIPLVAIASCTPQKVDSNCPQVYIAQDLGVVTRYKPGTNREAGNLLYAAEIRDIKGDCIVNSSDADVHMTFSIVGERGVNSGSAAGAGPISTASMVYFAAITDPTGLIVWKQEFTATLDFGNNRRAGTIEDLDPHIPLPKGGVAAGYKVLIGFQLTPQEIDDNRRARGATEPLPSSPVVVPGTPTPQSAPSPAPVPSVTQPQQPPATRPGDLLPGYLAPGVPVPH